jgi:hypothetical protein
MESQGMEALRRPLDLGDIFDRTFAVVGKTLVRNLFIGTIFFVPAAFFLALGFQTYFSSFADFVSQIPHTNAEMHIQQGEQNKPSTENDEPSPGIQNKKNETQKQLPPEEAMKASFAILGAFFLAGTAMLFFLAASICGRALCSYIVCTECNGGHVPWNEIFSRTSGTVIRRSLGQTLLESLVYIGTTFVIMAAVIIAVIFKKIGILIMIVLLIGCVVMTVFLSVRWSFTVMAIASEQTKALDSFGRSATLVRSHWWRTFGVLLLLGCITGFAVSLVTTPVGFLALWDFYSAYFHSLGSHAASSEPMQAAKMLGSIGWGFGVIIALSGLMKLLIEPAYKCVMYFDLRARHDEFPENPESSSPPFSFTTPRP